MQIEVCDLCENAQRCLAGRCAICKVTVCDDAECSKWSSAHNGYICAICDEEGPPPPRDANASSSEHC